MWKETWEANVPAAPLTLEEEEARRDLAWDAIEAWVTAATKAAEDYARGEVMCNEACSAKDDEEGLALMRGAPVGLDAAEKNAREAWVRAFGKRKVPMLARAKKEAEEPARVVWGWTADQFNDDGYGYHGPFNSRAEAEASCRATADGDGCIGYVGSGRLLADVLREAVKRISADEIVAAVNDAAHEDVDWDGDLFTTRDTPCWPGQREELFRFLLPWAQKNLVALDGLTWIISERKLFKVMREP